MKDKIKDMPAANRPYEKFRTYGAQCLSDDELLAIILRSGVKGESSIALAGRLLHRPGFDAGLTGLFHISLPELQSIRGIGEVKAIQIKCICELSRRMAKACREPSVDFHNPKTVADYYMEDLRHCEQEQLICIMLDTKNRFLGDEVISKGTVNSSPVSPREVFLKAMQYHAVHIILVHNHPSGNPAPSEDDLLVTSRVMEAGELLGIYLIDHIIIGDLTFVSLCNEGILPDTVG